MPRLKTFSLRTLLEAREKLPLRTDDRIEHLLERFQVAFSAGHVRKGVQQLQHGNLVLWFIDGTLNSVELTGSARHAPSDLVDWGGFAIHSDDLLAWCREQHILVALDHEAGTTQLWSTASGALIAMQDGALWNITLPL